MSWHISVLPVCALSLPTLIICLLCRRRITARECLAHPWISDVTLTQPIRSHYESSTSVDSSISLSMDNMVSSAETSPISSATSSFAAGQSSYDTNYSAPLEECLAVEDRKDSGIGHRVSLSTSLTQGLSAALISSVQMPSDDTRPQSRGNSSDWLGQQREVSPSPSPSPAWAEHPGRSASIDSTASGSGTAGDETAPVKRLPADSQHNNDASTPLVELADMPPSSSGRRASTEAESTRESQPQLCASPQLPASESRPVVLGKKDVSPEVNKSDEVMRLLREGLSLTDGSSGRSSPNQSNTSSCLSIEHRWLYTDSCGRTVSASKSVPSTLPEPGMSPAWDMPSARSSLAVTQQGMSEVMRLLTVGVPLTEGEEDTEAEQGPCPNKGGSGQADKPAESDVLRRLRVCTPPGSPRWQQRSTSSGTVSPQREASPHRRRTSKPRPDSFVLPVEVQEAILKGDLDLAKIEETPEGHPSPEKGKTHKVFATKRRQTAWN